MKAMTTYEKQTVFPYRRKKHKYWKLKTQIQTGKKRLASKLTKSGGPNLQRPYAHPKDIQINQLRKDLIKKIEEIQEKKK